MKPNKFNNINNTNLGFKKKNNTKLIHYAKHRKPAVNLLDLTLLLYYQ